MAEIFGSSLRWRDANPQTRKPARAQTRPSAQTRPRAVFFVRGVPSFFLGLAFVAGAVGGLGGTLALREGAEIGGFGWLSTVGACRPRDRRVSVFFRA